MDNTISPASKLFDILKRESAGMLGKFSLLEKSFELNGKALFDDSTSLTEFTDKCISDAKIKAKIARKTFPSLSQQQSLDLISNICYFDSWQDLVSAAKAIAELPVEHAITSGNAFKISIASWKITGSHLDDQFFMLTSMIASIWPLSTYPISKIEAEVFCRNLLGDSTSGKDSIPPESFVAMLKLINRDSRQSMLMRLLSKSPAGISKDNWGKISNLTTRDFLSKKLIDSDGTAKVVSDVIGAQIRGACHDFVQTLMPMSGMNFIEPLEFIPKLSLEQNATNAEIAGVSLLKDYLDRPLIEAVRYNSTPLGFTENIRTEYFYNLSEDGHKEFLLPPGKNGSFIKVHRKRIQSGYDDVKFYNVIATAFGGNGELIGFAICYFVKNPSCSLGYLGSALDEFANGDLSEMAISASFEYLEGVSHGFERMLFITHWQVSNNHRRLGVGRSLINSIIDHGIKGLGKPETVLGQNRPSSFPVPILEESDAASFYEYSEECKVINAAWSSCVENNKKFTSCGATFCRGGYNPIFHGAGNLEIVALHHWNSIDF